MIALVLFQKSEGGALGMGGSSGGGLGGFMSARGTANLLTRATGILATLFFLTTLGLAILFKGGATQKSILEDVAPIEHSSTSSTHEQTTDRTSPVEERDSAQNRTVSSDEEAVTSPDTKSGSSS